MQKREEIIRCLLSLAVFMFIIGTIDRQEVMISYATFWVAVAIYLRLGSRTTKESDHAE